MDVPIGTLKSLLLSVKLKLFQGKIFLILYMQTSEVLVQFQTTIIKGVLQQSKSNKIFFISQCT